MKNILCFALLVLTISVQAQDIDVLNYEQTQDINYYKAVKNNTTVGEYVASDGNSFKVGDELTLGPPFINRTFENEYRYIQMGKFGGAMGALMTLGDTDLPMVPDSFEGRKAVIGEIRTYHRGNKKKPLYVVLELVEPNGNSFVALTKRISVQDVEFALRYGEIAPKNVKMTRGDAIEKLKEAKELFELEMMTEEEYNTLRDQLTPIIRGN